MRKLATAAQMKRMDQIAIQERGIASELLMERAAHGIVHSIVGLVCPIGPDREPELPESLEQLASEELALAQVRNHLGKLPAVAVFSGPGNNGGDGIAVAWLLLRAGWRVRCFLVGKREKMTPDSLEMERRLKAAGGTLEEYDPQVKGQAVFAMNADVLVDALFGVGLNSALREPAASAVRLMNLSPAPVVCADIPSGVETDTGRILGDAVRADVTVTFSMAKPGLYVGKGALQAGDVMVWDIGIPEDIPQWETFRTVLTDAALAADWLPRRPADGHKGTFGKTLIVGGSVGFTGAPVLAARSALRTGAGLVTVLTHPSAYPIVAANCLEAMARPMPEDYLEILGMAEGGNGVLVGPGLGQGQEAAGLVPLLLRRLTGTVVVDADGINLLARHMDILEERPVGSTILTPHDGEFARLGGDLSSGDRLGAARTFAVKHRCVLVLKGHRTITAWPDGQCFVNPTGNSGMAKGGSGDVLGGMILSLLGQGLSPERAAVCAVWLHGRAGDLAAAEKGEYGMLPSDLIEKIPEAIRELVD